MSAAVLAVQQMRPSVAASQTTSCGVHEKRCTRLTLDTQRETPACRSGCRSGAAQASRRVRQRTSCAIGGQRSSR